MPTDADLLARFSPVLQYDSHELYYADAASTFTDNAFAGGPLAPYRNTLKRKDGTVIARAGRALSLGFLGPDAYGDGQPVRAGDYLDGAGSQYVADARRLHGDPHAADRAYGVVLPAAGGKRWLQYWLFYYYNDKSLVGMGIHEGDWEGYQVRVDAQGTPDEVTYAQHDGGERAAWSDVETDAATGAPVVYVGLGSHASYLRAGSHKAPLVDDVCDAKGARVHPQLEVLTDDAPSWVRWPGRWGASAKHGLISFPSPGAPRTQKRWRDPDAFHAAARRFQPDRGPGGGTVAVLPPVVTAVRDGETTTVTITGGGGARLVVTATVEGRPATLEYDLSEAPAGTAAPLRPLPPAAAR